MCPIQFRQDGPPYGPPAFMDFNLYTRIVDEFSSLKHLHLQGLGEPMMHPRFFEMVTYAAQKGIRVTTNTNLSLLNKKRAESCVTSGLDEIHISIDGARPETYERIRIRGKYDRIMRNLELLQQARQQAGSTTPHMKLVMVLMRQNLDELPELVRQAGGWQMEEMFVQHLSHDFTEEALPAHYRPMRDFVEAQTLLNENEQHITAIFDQARQVAAESGIPLRLPRTRVRPHPPGTPGPQRCSWPWSSAYIAYDGTAMPCCMIATPDRGNFGSFALQSVHELWNNDAYQDFRSRLSSEDAPDICKACSIYRGTF